LDLDLSHRVDLFRRIGAAILYIDGEIGAEKGAQSAVDTMRIIDEFRRVVPFGVGSF
jgi:hypothetical protein